MPTLTLIVTDYASRQELLRRSYVFVGDLDDAPAKARAAARRVHGARTEIAALLGKPLDFDRCDSFEWRVTAADLSSIPPLAWACVEFSAEHPPVPLPIEVTAELLPGRVDPNATGRFANVNRADQYARILIASGDYSAGGVWLADSNGARHRLG